MPMVAVSFRLLSNQKYVQVPCLYIGALEEHCISYYSTILPIKHVQRVQRVRDSVQPNGFSSLVRGNVHWGRWGHCVVQCTEPMGYSHRTYLSHSTKYGGLLQWLKFQAPKARLRGWVGRALLLSVYSLYALEASKAFRSAPVVVEKFEQVRGRPQRLERLLVVELVILPHTFLSLFILVRLFRSYDTQRVLLLLCGLQCVQTDEVYWAS